MRGLLRRAARLRDRRGAAAVLFGVLLPVIVGLTALAVDVSVVALARNQLSTAADAGALAGAMELADENRVRGAINLSTEITQANAQAAAFAQSNAVLNVSPVVVQDPNNQGTGDVRVGYLDPTNYGASLVTASASAPLFNSVEVTLSRNADRVAPVPTFFGHLMGFNGTNVTVKSTATVEAYSISGVQAIDDSTNTHLLPIVLDKTTYQAMMAGTTTDQYTYDSATNTVTSGSDGIHESRLYPITTGYPGNWGTINVGVSANSTSTLGAQIRNGVTPAQLATFPNSTIQLDTSLDPPQISFSGDPGISAGIKDDLVSIIGKSVILPIYDPDLSGGDGNNASFVVIKFQPIRILDVNFQANPKYVIIQPCLMTDATAIAGSRLTSWTSGGLIKLHLSR